MRFLLIACSLLGGTHPSTPEVRQDTLVHSTFATGEDGWKAVQIMGADAKLSVVHDADHVKVGTGSLKYGYNVKQGEVAAAYLPIADGALAKMRSLHFWLRSEHPAPIVVTLEEKAGGRYTAFVFGRSSWQEVNLGISDFTLSTEPDAPKDPDGKLDPDQIQSVAFADLEQFLVQNPQISKLTGVAEGTRALYLSDFLVAPDELPSATAKGNGEVRIDEYSRPQVGWGSLGLSDMRVEAGAVGGKSLRADYHVTPSHVCGMFRKFPAGTLAGTSGLTLHLGSAKPCKLLIEVEKDNGGKYNTTYDLPGDKTMLTASLAYVSFNLGDAPDPEGKLSPEHIHQVTIIDLTGMVDPKDQDNTLWITSVSGKL